MYTFVLYGGWMDLQNKRYEITQCLIVYKMFSLIMQSTSSVLSRIFHYHIVDLQT